MEKKRLSSLSPAPYGSTCPSGELGDTCPTCRGIGRIKRGHDQLVAVISCNDTRLKPKHTKLYMCISMVVCLFLSGLIIFFLFPRSIIIKPVSVQSVMVYFSPHSTKMEVTNIFSLTNENFLPIQIVEFDVEALVLQKVVSRTKMGNMTSIQARTQNLHTIQVDMSLDDIGLSPYCRSSTIKVHTLFLELQLMMNVSYLSHIEQISLDVFEYIDCGKNTTTPHPMT